MEEAILWLWLVLSFYGTCKQNCHFEVHVVPVSAISQCTQASCKVMPGPCLQNFWNSESGSRLNVLIVIINASEWIRLY